MNIADQECKNFTIAEGQTLAPLAMQLVLISDDAEKTAQLAKNVDAAAWFTHCL